MIGKPLITKEKKSLRQIEEAKKEQAGCQQSKIRVCYYESQTALNG
jgi:hypothetical protein